MMVVTATALFRRTFVGSGWSFEASSDTPGKPETVQVWPETFLNAMSAATWPAPSLAGTTRQVPEGISAVVQAEPPECVGAELGDEDAEVPAGELAGVEAEGVTEPVPATPSESDVDTEDAADVLASEVVLPGLKPALLFAVLPEHPAASTTAPIAPAAARTVIRFMGQPSRVTTASRRPVTQTGCH